MRDRGRPRRPRPGWLEHDRGRPRRPREGPLARQGGGTSGAADTDGAGDTSEATGTSDASEATGTSEAKDTGGVRPRQAVVHALVFVAFLDTFAMLPTVGPYADHLGAGALGVGVTVGAYSATNLVFNAVGGALLDRVGRRPLLLTGLVIAGASMGAYAAADGPASLVAARLLHGVGGGLLVPAVFTVAGDLAAGGARGRAMGRAGAVIGAAAVVAPGLSGALRQAAGFGAVFALVAACMACGVALVLVAIPRTAGHERAATREAPWRGLLRRPALLAALGGALGLTFAVGSTAAFVPLRLEALGQGPAAAGAWFTVFAIAAGAVMLSRLAGAVDAGGLGAPTAVGLAVVAVALGLLGVPGSAESAFAAAVLFGVGYGLVFPATAGALAAATDPDERGRAYGLYNIAFSLGLALGPPAAGVAAGAGVPFAPAMGVAVVVAAVLVAARRRLAATAR